MKQATAEWVAKAEGDFAMLERESRGGKRPSYDGICSHAQQCAEQYLKTRLEEAGRPSPRQRRMVCGQYPNSTSGTRLTG
jgi:HEPN domain-containing protein